MSADPVPRRDFDLRKSWTGEGGGLEEVSLRRVSGGPVIMRVSQQYPSVKGEVQVIADPGPWLDRLLYELRSDDSGLRDVFADIIGRNVIMHIGSTTIWDHVAGHHLSLTTDDKSVAVVVPTAVSEQIVSELSWTPAALL